MEGGGKGPRQRFKTVNSQSYPRTFCPDPSASRGFPPGTRHIRAFDATLSLAATTGYSLDICLGDMTEF